VNHKIRKEDLPESSGFICREWNFTDAGFAAKVIAKILNVGLEQEGMKSCYYVQWHHCALI
jgi:hypothetical protein